MYLLSLKRNIYFEKSAMIRSNGKVGKYNLTLMQGRNTNLFCARAQSLNKRARYYCTIETKYWGGTERHLESTQLKKNKSAKSTVYSFYFQKKTGIPLNLR